MNAPRSVLPLTFKRLCDQGRWQDALMGLRLIEQQHGGQALVPFARGYYHLHRGAPERAREHFAEAFALDPEMSEAAYSLVKCDRQLGHYLNAAADLEALLQKQPFELPALQELAGLYQLTGQIQALQVLGQVLLQPGWACQPGFRQAPPAQQAAFLAWLPQLQALLILSVFAAEGAGPEFMPPLLAAWRQHALPKGPPPFLPPYLGQRDPERPLRIGYVSREWGSAPLELGFGMLFQHHDASQFTLLAYCDSGRPAGGKAFERIYASASWDNPAFAAQIRADSIDVLVDLSGLFNASRLPVFALRPAPVQILAGANPPFVTGLPTIDAVFSDRVLMPPAIAAKYPEQFCYQASFFHWQPPSGSPAPGPVMPEGQPRLGVLAAPHKLNAASFRLWAGLLAALPAASLSLKHQTLSDPRMRAELSQQLAAAGGDASRLRFVDNRQAPDYFSFLAGIDLLIDTFPYSGALSSCDALWMGVPVLSLRGGHHLAESIARSLGTDAFLARDEAELIGKAQTLCADPSQLAELRRSLRAQLLSAPICDGIGQAREAEQDYRRLWRAFCKGD